ncbi:MAG TPA: 2-phospho-L-lactate guanylyltransferase [Candidatus Dormibacteraeota bacterium]
MKATWVVVLVKDFDTAKQRLGPVLAPGARRALALENAERAIRAAAGFEHCLVVAGSEEARQLADRLGTEVLLEAHPAGQNPAARAGIMHAQRAGATEVLVVSSDIPGVSAASLQAVVEAAGTATRVVVAAAAVGRGGTNALFLRPPGAIDLHFGDDSLAKFERDARDRGVPFVVLEDTELALDLDEPSDLALLEGSR